MTEVSSELISAYIAAIYQVDGPGANSLPLRIGEANASLDALLARAGVREAAFITAYNPVSARLCEAENRAAHENLLNEVRRCQLAFLPARGVDPNARWPDEPGLLVLGVTREDAIRIARAFDQNGLVYCAVGAPPELVLVR